MRLGRVLAKITAFVAVCVLSAVLVVNTLNNPVGGDTVTYHAVFTDSAGLRAGNDVRMAGVRVGAVDEVELDNGVSLVTFRVRTERRVPASARAAVRYADLLGARYLAVRQGDAARERRLEPGSTIPDDRTSPPVDLTALLNGFKPLFDTLDPAEVNRLAMQLVDVLQGQGGALSSVLGDVVALTSTLHSKDKVIGEVIDNLNRVMETMNGRGDEGERLVGSLGELADSVAGHRELIAEALRGGADLADSLRELLGGLEPEIGSSVAALRDITATLTSNQRALSDVLDSAPGFLRTLNRTVDYGTWVNVYVCALRVDVTGGGHLDLSAGPNSKVCR